MSLGRSLVLSLLLCALTACPGGGSGDPTDGGPQPGDSGTPGAPELPSTALWETTVGVPFERVLRASGGSAPLTYTAQGTPAGLVLDAQSGTLSGSPTLAGRFELDVSVRDAAGRDAQQRYFLLVLEAPAFATSALPAAIVGSPYAAHIETSGGKPPLTYSASAGALPAGLVLDSSGAISGTPSAPGTSSFEISVTDAHGAVKRAPFALEVRHAPPVFVTSQLPPAYVSQTYRFPLAAEGGAQPYTWRKAQGTFPTGIELTAAGELAGTASSPGTATFTLEVRDARGQSAQKAFTLSVLPPLAITTTSLPDAYRGSAYPAALEASGGSPPYAWAFVTGTLPPGLALGSEGTFSGALTATGVFSFTARVTDSQGNTSSRTLTVTSYLPPAVSPAVLAEGYVGESYSDFFSATDGKPPYTFSFTSGTLPPGLTVQPNGALSGTPTASGNEVFEVVVRDANGRTGARGFSVPIYAPVSLSPVVPDARQGEFYSHPLSASGGKQGYTFTLVSGAPPTGLSLSPSGLLSGTPTGGSSSFTVRVRDVNNRSETRTLSLTVYTPPRITTTALPDATLNTPYLQVLGYSGGRGSLRWGWSGTLPPGLTFVSDGSVRGTPTATGTWSFTATLQDSAGDMDSRVFPITVRALPPDGGTLPDAGTPSDGGTGPDAGSPDGGTRPDGGTFPDGGTDGGTRPDGGTDGGPPSDAGIPFTVAHWNIEWFGSDTQGPPRSTSAGGPLDDIQFANVRSIVLDAGVNLWGLIEITDGADFQALKAQLPGYDGFLSDDPRVNLGSSYYSPTGQKLGVLYDSRLTPQSATLILTAFANDFAGRPPLRVDFVTPIDGVDSELSIIVVHMKAFADQSSYDRRQRASLALKNYLDALPSSRVLVVGDWNDDVDQSITFNAGLPLPSPYENFTQDFNDYAFVTRPLSLAGQSSTTSFSDMIDHTLVTDEVTARYFSGSVHVLRPTWIPDYAGTTSDHYPVLSRYDFGAPPAPPTLTLTSPNGGSYAGNSQLPITWEASASVGAAVLEYSLDSGASWNSLVYLPDAVVGRYTWTVPNVDSTSVLLRIYKANTGWPVSVSAVPFTLYSVPPPPLIFINEYLPNEPSGPLPDGGTGALTDYEFVELYNGDTVPVDLSQWTLWDGTTVSGPRHVFAPGTVLQAGQAWVVYGGASAFPPGTPNTVAASSGRLGLNNGGPEAVLLRDPSGALVSEHSYELTQDNVSFNRAVDADPYTNFVLHWNISPLQSSAGRRADGTPF